MEAFGDFLSTARKDRSKQIYEYERKNYLTDNKYRMTEQIKMLYYGKYGCQVSSRDFYFYIIDNKENAYYSIVELYKLLHRMCQHEGNDFVADLLKKIELSRTIENSGDYIEYRGIQYSIRQHIEPERDGSLDILDGSVTLSYKKMIGLLILIQEKSNYFWNSGDANKPYIDGILRLFNALINSQKDNPILKNKGWTYSNEKDEFEYVGQFSTDDKKERKVYYLTEGELDDIISSES